MSTSESEHLPRSSYQQVHTWIHTPCGKHILANCNRLKKSSTTSNHADVLCLKCLTFTLPSVSWYQITIQLHVCWLTSLPLFTMTSFPFSIHFFVYWTHMYTRPVNTFSRIMSQHLRTLTQIRTIHQMTIIDHTSRSATRKYTSICALNVHLLSLYRVLRAWYQESAR